VVIRFHSIRSTEWVPVAIRCVGIDEEGEIVRGTATGTAMGTGMGTERETKLNKYQHQRPKAMGITLNQTPDKRREDQGTTRDK